MKRKLNINRRYNDTVDRRPAGNSGFAKKRVQWLIEHSTSHQLLCYVDSFELRNPLLRKAAKRSDVIPARTRANARASIRTSGISSFCIALRDYTEQWISSIETEEIPDVMGKFKRHGGQTRESKKYYIIVF
jgi:hypothetical protein